MKAPGWEIDMQRMMIILALAFALLFATTASAERNRMQEARDSWADTVVKVLLPSGFSADQVTAIGIVLLGTVGVDQDGGLWSWQWLPVPAE